MLKRTSLIAIALLCTGCPNTAGDCNYTLSCELPDTRPSCGGVCAPIGTESEGWTRAPFLFTQPHTMGLPKNACPDSAPRIGFQGHATPDQTLTCPSCSCAPPTGACLLPETATAGPSPMCPSDAGVPFNPPSAWDGGCTANDAITDIACDGGTCPQSVTVSTMILTESCAPLPPDVAQDVKWADLAYACEGEANGTCPSAGDICVPKASDGFALCVSREGDDDGFACPPEYPSRYVFYHGAIDTRTCAPCTCEPPEGSTCSSLMSFYTDGACAEQIASVTATNASSMCAEIPAGSPLGSKQANPPTYTPGSCKPSGGEEVGSVQPAYPFTFCCQE